MKITHYCMDIVLWENQSVDWHAWLGVASSPVEAWLKAVVANLIMSHQ